MPGTTGTGAQGLAGHMRPVPHRDAAAEDRRTPTNLQDVTARGIYHQPTKSPPPAKPHAGGKSESGTGAGTRQRAEAEACGISRRPDYYHRPQRGGWKPSGTRCRILPHITQ